MEIPRGLGVGLPARDASPLVPRAGTSPHHRFIALKEWGQGSNHDHHPVFGGILSCDTDRVEYLTEKWGGAAHKRGPLQYLGRDQFGSWLWGAAGRRIQMGESGSFVTEQDAIFLIPQDTWWTCAWWIGHPEVELYVDICTPAQWEDGRIRHVDLDLDVIRFLNGCLEIDDRDEFEAHRVEYGYPQEIVDGANAAVEEVFDMISRNASPFDGIAARDWAKEARTRSQP